MKEYKLELHQLRKFLIFPLLKLIVVIALFTILSIYWFEVEADRIPFVVTTSLIWVMGIHVFPTVIIATFHYVRSKNTVIEFNKLYKEYTVKINQSKIQFNSDQIERVVKCLSPPKFDNRADFLGFGHFYYWVLHLKNGEAIPISCLIIDSEEVFASSTVEKEKKFLAIPPSYKYSATGGTL